MVVQGLAACIHVVVSENAKTARSNPINVARPFKAARGSGRAEALHYIALHYMFISESNPHAVRSFKAARGDE